MDDWELHFVEKSRRRFEVERAERRRERKVRLIAGLLVASSIVAGIAGLAALR